MILSIVSPKIPLHVALRTFKASSPNKTSIYIVSYVSYVKEREKGFAKHRIKAAMNRCVFVLIEKRNFWQMWATHCSQLSYHDHTPSLLLALPAEITSYLFFLAKCIFQTLGRSNKAGRKAANRGLNKQFSWESQLKNRKDSSRLKDVMFLGAEQEWYF